MLITFGVGVSERMKDERAHSAEVLITLVGVLDHPGGGAASPPYHPAAPKSGILG